MNNALLITKYYLKRAFSRPLDVALMTLLPVGIIVVNVMLNMNIINLGGGDTGDMYFQGFNIEATVLTMFILVMFQTMSGVYAGEFVFTDFRDVNKWRRRALPVPSWSFTFAAVAASVLFSFATAVFILVVMHFGFSIYLGNWFIVLPLVFLVGLWAQFIGIIVAMFVSKKSVIDGVTIILGFVLSSLSGTFLIAVPIPAVVRDFVIPTGVAVRGIVSTNIITTVEGGVSWMWGDTMTDSLMAIGIMVAHVIVAAIVAVVLMRRKVS